MNPFLKKVSYFTLGGLVCSASLTACVDNDEPYGIEQIRLSLAELLKSKCGIAEAEAALKNAQAAVEQARVAVINAQAAQEQAEADRLAAVAKEALAQAEYQAANYKLMLEKSQHAWELQKAQADQQLASVLDGYYKAYAMASADYEAAYQNLIAEMQNQLNGEYNSADNIKNAKDAVASAKEAVAADSTDIAELEAAIAVEANATQAAYAGYKEQVKKNEEQLKALNVQLAELEVKYPDIYGAYKKPIDIDAYTWKPSAQLEALAPGQLNPIQITAGGTYTIEDVKNNPNGNLYTTTVNKYNTAIAVVENFLLDNGIAWTQGSLAQAAANEKTAQKAADATKAKWETAVKFYNGGAGAKNDVLFGADSIARAVTNYNAAATHFNDSVAALNASKVALDKADKALSESAATKVGEIQAANAKAIEAAQKVYDEAVKAAKADLTASATDRENQRKALENILTEAQAREAYLQNLVDGNVSDENGGKLEATTADIKALATASAAVVKAQTALDKFDLTNSTIADKEMAIYNATVAAAWRDYQEAIVAANTTMNDALIGVAQDAPSAAQDAYNAAAKTFAKDQLQTAAAYNKLVKAETALEAAPAYQATEFGVSAAAVEAKAWNKFVADYNKAVANYTGNVYKENAVPAATNAGCSYFADNSVKDAEVLVKATSEKLYGNTLASATDFGGRLVPLTKEEAINLMKVDAVNNGFAQLTINFTQFGQQGNVWQMQQDVEIATAAVNNPNLIAEAVAPLKENLKKVTDAYTAQATDSEEIKALEDPIKKEIAAIQNQNSALQNVINAYESNYNNQDDNLDYAGYIDSLKKDLKTAQDQLKKDTDALAKAETLLEKTEKGEDIEAELLKFNLAQAQAKVDVAKARVDAAKAALDAATEKYANA